MLLQARLLAYRHQPFVVEGDADGEDVVKENQSDDAKSPAYELHRVSHMGLLKRTGHLQPCLKAEEGEPK